jgi:IMP dehydrogenase
MLGSLLAGCAESPGSVLDVGGRRVKVHRGMASAAARKVRFALDRYSLPAKGLEEGIEAYVPYAGKAKDVLGGVANGLRASFGYAGAKSVADLWRVASFGMLSAAGSATLSSRSPATTGLQPR